VANGDSLEALPPDDASGLATAEAWTEARSRRLWVLVAAGLVAALLAGVCVGWIGARRTAGIPSREKTCVTATSTGASADVLSPPARIAGPIEVKPASCAFDPVKT